MKIRLRSVSEWIHTDGQTGRSEYSLFAVLQTRQKVKMRRTSGCIHCPGPAL
jgi:uncharacterized Fe-S cluster-containing MiaB family protein